MEIFVSVCMLFAGIAVFLLGMKLMGDGLEKGAGKSVKKVFARIGDNRLAGVGIGAGTTAVIQSSSATTVMVVGFVNAGTMTLLQAAAIIMGANIGTTVTAYLGILGDLPIASFFMAAGIAGVFMYMFSKNKKAVCAGEIITGLSVLFVGMSLMGGSFKNSDKMTGAFIDMFVSLSHNPVGPLLLVLVGAVFTGIIQSSSATTVMVVGMAVEGIIPVDAALFIVMGANIGTCVTALIASIGTSANAKRAALFHLAFNTIGTIIFVPIVWPLRSQISALLGAMFTGNPGLQVAFFHTFFNVVTTAVLIGLIKYLTAFVTKLIPGKKGEGSDELRLYFIGNKVFKEAPIDLVLKETMNMAELARENLGTALRAALAADDSQRNKIIGAEQKINFINKGICRYLVLLSKDPLPEEDRKFRNSLHYVVSDIERIGDHAMDFLEGASEMKDGKIKFSDAAIKELQEMHQKVDGLFAKAVRVFESRDAAGLGEISALEREIDEEKRTLGIRHVSRLNNGECTVEGGMHFYALITGLERVADHLTNIAFSVESTSGAQLEILKRLSKENAKKRSEKTDVYW